MNPSTNRPPLTPFARTCFLPIAQNWLTKGWLPAALLAAKFAAAAQADVIQWESLVIGGGDIFLVEENTTVGLTQTGSPESDTPIGQTGLVIDTLSLSIHPTGQLDLKDNAMIVRTGSFANVYGYLVTGYNGGLWNGYGISSSTAAADPAHLTAVGIINNAEAQYSMFEGRALGPAAESLVKFAYYGDANLDGDVNAADAALFNTGAGWYHGDFNYDGAVNALDIALFNAGFLMLHPTEQVPQVPEPGTLSLLAAALAGLAGRLRTPEPSVTGV